MTDDQFFLIAGLLTEIRDALAPVDPPREYDDDGRCLHPEELRVPLGRDEWACRRCKFQFSGVDHAQATL